MKKQNKNVDSINIYSKYKRIIIEKIIVTLMKIDHFIDIKHGAEAFLKAFLLLIQNVLPKYKLKKRPAPK
jgi:hypothetical protein